MEERETIKALIKAINGLIAAAQSNNEYQDDPEMQDAVTEAEKAVKNAGSDDSGA